MGRRRKKRQSDLVDVHVRLEPEVAQELTQLADEKKRSLSSQVSYILSALHRAPTTIVNKKEIYE